MRITETERHGHRPRVAEVELFDFMEAGIMFGLDIDTDADGVTLSFDSSYGVHGRLKAKRIVVSFEPGKI